MSVSFSTYEPISILKPRDPSQPKYYHLRNRNVTFSLKEGVGQKDIDFCVCQQAIEHFKKFPNTQTHDFPQDLAEKIHQVLQDRIKLFEALSPDHVDHNHDLELKRIDSRQREYAQELEIFLAHDIPFNEYGSFLTPNP